MRNKNKFILSLFLSFLLIFSNLAFVYAEDEIVNDTSQPKVEEIKVEEQKQEEPKEVEEKTEEKVEEKIEEKTEEKAEEENIENKNTTENTQKAIEEKEENVILQQKNLKAMPQEEKQEVHYPIKITWHIKYRDANGEWTEFKSSLTDTIPDSNTALKYPKPFSVLQSKVVKGELYNAEENITYKFNNKYIDNYGNSYVTLIKAIAAGVDYEGNADVKIRVNQSVDVYFTAQYSEVKPVYNLTGIYDDKIGHTSGSWATVNNSGTISYTHTFKDAADVPENYRFEYWKNYDDNDIVYANGERTWDLTALGKDTEVTYKATYQPIITINYYDEDGTFFGSVTHETIDIYKDFTAPEKSTKFLGWYENDNLILEDTIKHLDLTTIEVQTDFSVYAKYEIPPIPEPEPEPAPLIPQPIPVPIPQPIPTQPTSQPKPTKPIVQRAQPQTIMAEVPQLTAEYSETKVISDPQTPKAMPEKYWALLNLILSILTVIFGLIFVLHGKDDDLEVEDKRKANIAKIIAALVAIVSVIIFIFTEDMTVTMVWIDKWTILMAIILIGELIIDYYIHKKSQNDNEEEEEEELDG